MSKEFKIQINSIDLGQVLDGLRFRAESWRDTESYMESGNPPHEFFLAEDCNDAEEARKIAEHYETIISSIEQQVDAQGGW